MAVVTGTVKKMTGAKLDALALNLNVIPLWWRVPLTIPIVTHAAVLAKRNVIKQVIKKF